MQGKVCGDCESAYVGPDGLFCMTFRQIIADEGVAEECEAFSSIPAAVITEWVARPEPVPEAIRRVLVASNDEIHEVLVDHSAAALPSPELVAACEQYLSERHCVLWGLCFEIHSTSGRAEAAQWLATQITAVNVAP